MKQSYHITATLMVDPRAPGRRGRRLDGWLIAQCDPTWGDYLRWHLQMSQGGPPLRPPEWPGWIPVISGATCRRGAPWWALAGREITARLHVSVCDDALGWWCPITSPALETIRAERGLPPLPRAGFRLFIARALDINPVIG